jgi:vitamin B12 transporter
MQQIIRTGAAALSTVALAAAAWSVSAPARAQAQIPDQAQTASSASADTLEEVQVTAQRLEQDLPQDLAAAGVEVDTIPAQAIRNGGYQDVAGALSALAPGLFILPKNGPFDYVQISMLGSRTEDVLWLIDGVRFNNRLYSSTTPLDTMPSSIVDHLEVLQGGQALFYGTEAVAGAINIVTKPFSNSANGAGSISADTNNARHVDFNFADSVGFGQVVLYGSADKSTGYQAFRTQDYQPSSTHRDRGYDVTTLGGKYGVDLSANVRLEASWQHTDGDLDFAYPYRVAQDVNSRREDLATLKLDIQATDRLGLYIKSYYHNWHTTYDQYYNDLATFNTADPTLDVLYQNAFWGYKDYGLNALGKYDISRGVQLYFGYDLQRYGGRDQVLVITQHDEQTQAGFAQLRLTPALVPHLTLAGGLRYNSPSVGQQATIWNVSGLYDLPANLYVKGEVGTNFRLPDAEELFANDPADERGNPNLRPEKSRSANVSFGGRFGPERALHWQLTGFARDIDDLIELNGNDVNAADQEVFDNVPGTVRVRGAEGLIEAALADSLSANVNYTYSHSVEDSGQQLDNVPKGLFKAGVDYHPGNLPFGAAATVNYVGDTAVTVHGSDLHYGRYAVVDLSGRYYVDAKRHQQINFSIRNLFDRQYGLPARGCADVATDGPYDCSSPYFYVNLGLPRTFAVSYTYRFF